MILSVPFVYFLVPETKGIPLEDMNRLFSVQPVWKAHATVLAEVREHDEEFRHDAEGAGLSAEKSQFEPSQIEYQKV